MGTEIPATNTGLSISASETFASVPTSQPVLSWEHGTMDTKQRCSLFRRLYSRVEYVPETGCWVFVGGLDKNGYGKIWQAGADGRSHRAAWELENGPIPEGLYVLHHCDNPPCINVTHLFLGTNADNMRDKRQKGRAAHGENHGQAKLTTAQVRAIRKDKRTQMAIAADYGCTQTAISLIKNRKNWDWLD